VIKKEFLVVGMKSEGRKKEADFGRIKALVVFFYSSFYPTL